ncbi:MAG TPA: type II secretion system protein [Candidatus Eisenbacteria bacterium]|nr:type II secretion system protein [Candidatus Eisenbacteria bacterium]
MATRRRGAAGFTLTELLIVIVVTSIAGLVLSGVLREAVRTYAFVDVEKELVQESRYAKERMTREVMGAPRGGIREAGPRSITVVDADSAIVTFAWDGVRGSDLVCVRDGARAPLASHVDSLAFAYFDGSGRPLHSTEVLDRLHRVSIYLRLARDGHEVQGVGSAFLRSAT